MYAMCGEEFLQEDSPALLKAPADSAFGLATLGFETEYMICRRRRPVNEYGLVTIKSIR